MTLIYTPYELLYRIVSVSKKFDRQLARINDKKEVLLNSRSEMQQEESPISCKLHTCLQYKCVRCQLRILITRGV